MNVPELVFRDALLLDVACALSVHAIYKHYEPNASLLPVHFLLLIIVPILPTIFFLPHFQGSLETSALFAFPLFYSALVLSIIVYRLSPWHPLARYPGPVLAKLTKFWGAVNMAKGKHHLLMKRLHEKYGPYVRIGPNEISVLDVSAIPSILGADGMPKGPMWDVRSPQNETPSLIAMRFAHQHAVRRKRWNRAFNTAAVKGYEPIVQKRALQLVDELEKRSTKCGVHSVCLSEWLSYFTTDFMGDMAFGGGFELMRDGGDKEGLWTLMEHGLRNASILQHIPWLMPLLRKFPSLTKANVRVREFGKARALARKVEGSMTKDLFYHLIDEEHIEPIPPTEKEIISDAVLAIIAGSDTTSTTLSGLFYYLLSNPLEYKRLQNELDAAFPPGEGDPFDTTKLAEMEYLNAVINEAMRLQPPVPTYLQRAPEKGSGGKWVGDHFINEGTSVIVPPYALFRNPAYFSPAPDTFWPDRWLHHNHNTVKRTPHSASASSGLKPPSSLNPNSSEKEGRIETEEVITNTSAFIPFSYGPAHCAGRALALTEMRMVVALLMQRFNFEFAEGYDPNTWEEELEDYFVLRNGELRVRVTMRV